MSQKYVVVHFVDALSVPADFPMTEWPLHITLLANFQISSLDSLRDKLSDLAANTKPFTAKVDGEARFGPRQTVAVSLIHPDEHIKALHRQLLKLTSDMGAVYDEPMYNAEGYRPHATIQQKSRLHDQQTITLDSLTLVDMYPDQDIRRRRIVETYRFGGVE